MALVTFVEVWKSPFALSLCCVAFTLTSTMPRAWTGGVRKSVGGSSCMTGEGANDGKEEEEGEGERDG
jgi:hypothetical protein